MRRSAVTANLLSGRGGILYEVLPATRQRPGSVADNLCGGADMADDTATPSPLNPSGLCECGCGGRTSIAKQTKSRQGHVKGQYVRFINPHQIAPPGVAADDPGPNPSGLCLCGCGELAPIATVTHRKYGWVRGKAKRFIAGHSGRKYPETYTVDPVTGCWVWNGRKNDHGYGCLSVDGVGVYAHRHFYEQEHGPIPEGMNACHHCDNPPCVNPAHLFLGTPRSNAEDRTSKGRSNNGQRDKTHCPHGHPYAGENLVVTSRGHRACRACTIERKRGET